MIKGKGARWFRHSFVAAALAIGVRVLPCGAEPTSTPQTDSPWTVAGSWRQPEGLPQDTVITLLQTRDGYIWVGTRGGLSRFDGVRFTTFDDRNKSELRDNEVWALAESDDGSLWIGVYGAGLSRLRGGAFTQYTSKSGLVNDFVRALVTDTVGALWIGTDGGLSRFKDGVFTSYTTKNGLAGSQVRALSADPDGSVWIGTPGGLQRWKDGRLLTVPLAGPPPVIESVLRDQGGALWIATTEGLLRLEGGKTTRYTTADGLSANRVYRLHQDLAGQVWMATSAGLDRYTGASPPAKPIRTEMRTWNVAALLSDKEGNLWVGYRGDGLARLHQGVFRVIGQAEGLGDADVSTLLEGREGALWIGTLSGLSVLRPGGLQSLTGQGLPRSAVSSLAEDRAGYLWVGTQAGLFKSTAPTDCASERCAPLFAPILGHPMLATEARVIHEDARGVVWVGTNLSGVARIEDGRVSVLTTADGLSNGAVRALADDGEGGLWIGTKGGGLDRWKDGKFTRLTEKDGLPNANVQALHRGADRRTLWIATRQGLSRLKEGRFKTITVNDGLLANHIYGFVDDAKGNLWMGTGKGIFRVDQRELEDFADGKVPAVVSIVYGREHGLDSTSAAVGHHPVAVRTRDDRLWFGTLGGLAVVDPRTLRTDTLPPPVHIEQVRIDHRTYPSMGTAEAPPGAGDIELQYTALSFQAPEKIRFRYRLEGFDHDWVDAGERRMAFYTNVPPGSYRFRVVARNSDGVWNETGAELSLRLLPRFFETRWFYAACALGVLLCAGGIHLARVRRLEARERLLSARVEAALAEVKVLSGLLPLCASCNKIRDAHGAWSPMEAYVHTHSEADFSHGMCPECAERLYPGLAARIERKRTEGRAG